MKSINRGLFIGRFQPFHNGHLSVVKKALQEVDQLIIGIGSAEDNFLPENPFTCSERYQMIENTLLAEGITADKFSIFPARNIHNYALWVDHVQLLIPPFSRVYTGSQIVKQLFQHHGNYDIADVDKELPINATKIRDLMKSGGDWQSLVPGEVVSLVEEWGGVERLKHVEVS